MVDTLKVLDADDEPRTVKTIDAAITELIAQTDRSLLSITTNTDRAIAAIVSAATAGLDSETINASRIIAALEEAVTDLSAVSRVIQAGENHVGQIGGHTPSISATMVRAVEGVQFAAGDLIANTSTAANVVPISFNVSRSGAAIQSGRITGCQCVITPSAGNVNIEALDFDLILFRPAPNIPFAAGAYPADNAALSLSAAMMKQAIAVFSFNGSDWRNHAGATDAGGLVAWQAVALSGARLFAPYNLAGLGSSNILGLLQARNTWTPGTTGYTFDFALDVDQD